MLPSEGFKSPKKFSIVWSIVPHPPHPGDVFNVVENDKDRTWRVEALLVCGVIRLAAREEGDIQAANKLVEKSCSSPDEFERAAAEAAKKMTRQDLESVATE